MNFGTFAGAFIGGGAYLLYEYWRARQPSLLRRVEPYLRIPHAAQLRNNSPQAPNFLHGLVLLSTPWFREFLNWTTRVFDRKRGLSKRLKRAGSKLSATEFRAQQLLWAAAGLAAALLFALPLLAAGRLSLPLALSLIILAPTGAALSRDWLLSQAVARHEAALARQLPTISELLALAVGAGETPLAALERITAVTTGELSTELRRTIADIHSGTPIDLGLKNLARRSEVPALSRFADALAVAIERGTPLAQVLHDQARDAREESRRSLLELSGRKEIAMLVPVIFFILPITVLFAVFPGIYLLQGGL